MKKLLFSLFLLLSAGQSMMAQEAFYIYRNDGNFDGFFYDQVKRMNLSKVDFDGVEHDDYVIQEVLTDDSLYRIPIISIDSISFVQPEIIFNPRLKNMAGSVADHFAVNSRTRGGSSDCMTDWVRKVEPGYSSYSFFFDKDTPKELVPQVGDVLVDFYNPMYKKLTDEDEDYTGFSGKVVASYEYSDDTKIVITEPISSLSDIFVQFITVEEVVEDESGAMSRRLAGWPDETARTRAQGASTASLLDINVPLKRDFQIGSGKLGVELGVGMKVKLGVTYNISMSNLFVKTILVEDFTLKGAVSGKYDGDYEAAITGIPQFLNKILFPAAAPVFQTRPLPNAFLRVKGEMGAKLDLPTVGFHSKQVMTFDTDDSPMMSCSYSVEGPNGEPQKGILDGTDLTLYMNGSVQIGAKFSANIETNDWVDAVFHSGIAADFYVGPQVDGQIELKANLADLLTGNVPGLYSSMKESNLSLAGLAANVEVKGELKILEDEEKETFMELNRKWMEKKWYLFPKITSNEVEFDQENRLVKCRLQVERPVFMMEYLGQGIYDAEGNCIDKQFTDTPYFLSEENNVMECDFEVPCGRYWVRPILRLAGAEIEVDDPEAEQEVVVTPMLYHETPNKKDIVQMTANEDKIEILFNTDAKDIYISMLDPNGNVIYDNTVDAFVDEWDPLYTVRTLTVMCGKNTAPLKRRLDFLLSTNVGSFETTDTICIIQESGHPQKVSLKIKLTGPYKGTRHLWGNNEQGSWDTTEDCEEAYFEESWPADCSYSGDLMTLTVNASYGDPNPEEEESNYADENRTENIKSSYYYYRPVSASLTIDLEEPRVTSGNLKATATTIYRFYRQTHMGENWSAERTETNNSKNTYETHWSSVPFAGSSRNGYPSFGLWDMSCVTSTITQEIHNREVYYNYRDNELYKHYDYNDNRTATLTGITVLTIELAPYAPE